MDSFPPRYYVGMTEAKFGMYCKGNMDLFDSSRYLDGTNIIHIDPVGEEGVSYNVRDAQKKRDEFSRRFEVPVEDMDIFVMEIKNLGI
jgi:hypothetical protein